MRVKDDLTGKILHAQMADLLLRRKSGHRFPGSLEERFERDRRSIRSHHLRMGVLIALVIYDLFLISDYHFFRQHFLRCVVLRLLIVTPLILCTYLWLHIDPPKRLRESLTLVVSCVVSFTTLYLWHGGSGVAAVFAQTALVLMILFVNTIMRLRFFYALASTFFCVIDGAIFLQLDHMLTRPEKDTSLSLVITGAVLTLISNYWMEREERLNYLLRLQLERRGIELTAANHELTRLSNLDALTGLANRRLFSIFFAEIWEHTIATRQSLSLMLIDIDRFKEINDEYGHLRGDEVLASVARALQEQLWCEEFKIARYGGEEFVVVLPGVGLNEALIIAERLRLAVRRIQTAPQDGTQARNTTVSIGVASKHLSRYRHRDEMLRDADLALYEAKTHGRDCVRPASSAATDPQRRFDSTIQAELLMRTERVPSLSNPTRLAVHLR
ncbi:MAG TPA: GGDEF domain-containing protein [Acidobacteriaceae bacterium]